MQQGGGSQSQYAEMTGAPSAATMGQQPVESASPISSRPPSNLDELTRLSSDGGGGDEDVEGDRAGGGATGKRWPRQETLTLLKIRSDMDAVFRDATIKGPLWEEVSRKLAEFGYRRSAKKCKEKFENVHKYYKRTKEGRASRQDGKSYKFFSQLEALHTATTTTATTSNVSASLSMPMTNVTASNTVTLDVAPVSIGIPISISSSVRVPTSPSTIAPMSSSIFPPNLSATISPTIHVPGSATTQPPVPPPAATATATTPVPISFSSDGSSSPETEDDDDDEDDIDFEGEPSNTAGSTLKRKRQSSSSTSRMMEFFESLMKQVMQKQESMQRRFLEAIEKREQDRMIREEAWKRQEMTRLAREHELMAQERAISASRDAAIISFLQKITGQTIQLPPAAPPPPQAPAPPPPPPPPPAPLVVAPAIPVPTSTLSHLPLSIPQEQRDQQSQRRRQQQHQQQQHQSQHAETLRHQPASTSLPSSEVVIAIPEQQVPPQPQEIGSSGNFEPPSSRWPKVEVLALIKLRSGLEPRFQEPGPKGPLWEEISTGMQRIGYTRNAKRCKEKWENINKYFKKVKEGNKKRSADAKTCPYFHELDALYRKKIIGSSSGTSSFSSQNRPEEPLPGVQHQQESIKLDPVPPPNPQESCNVPTRTPPQQLTQPSESDKQNVANVDAQASIGLGNRLFREGNEGSSKKPEDIVKELMNQQERQQQQLQQAASLMDDFDKYSDRDNMEEDEDDEDDVEDADDEDLEERKMGYKVEFQRQNANASNGGGSGTPSFLAVAQ